MNRHWIMTLGGVCFILYFLLQRGCDFESFKDTYCSVFFFYLNGTDISSIFLFS